jgi:general secretion pathway protein K
MRPDLNAPMPVAVPRARPIARARRQRGAALLMAMIIVTLVATLAASMVWQQWRAVQVETAERARTQSAWILAGALDWARLILREDAKNGGADTLGEPWAVPLAEARLSTFLAADKDNTDDAPDAFLSGQITDAQSRYNLTNLTQLDQTGKPIAKEIEGFQALCEAIGASPDLATRIATGLIAAKSLNGANGTDTAAPLLPVLVSQLTWLGIDPDTVRLLTPYVTLLPNPSPVNVNTAAREVLVAAIPGLDLASAERLVQVRQRTPFKSVDEIKPQLPNPLMELAPGRIGVTSNYFEVRGRLRLGDRTLDQTSLVWRNGKQDMVVLWRQRTPGREQPGS